MNIQDAIAALGTHTGLASLSLDQQDECSIEVDGRLSLTFAGAPHETTIEAVATLMPTGAIENCADILLDLNFASVTPDGGWFAIDKNTGDIVMRSRCNLAHLEEAKVIAFFDGFAKAALHWMDQLPSFSKVAGDTLKDLQDETLIRI